MAEKLVTFARTMPGTHGELVNILKSESEYVGQSRGMHRWGSEGYWNKHFRDHYKMNDGSVVINSGECLKLPHE